MTSTTRICFVCLGNICRSPLAEGVFLHLAEQRGMRGRFVVDSCGTGHWHIGKRPDPRSIEIAAKHGIELPSRGRQFDAELDPERFDLFVAMDHQNMKDLIDRGTDSERVRLMRSFDPATPDGADVPDPYYGEDDGFQVVYEMLLAACSGLLDRYDHARNGR